MLNRVNPSKQKMVKEAVSMAQATLEKHSDGAEAILVTFHVVKDGRIYHHYEYSNFPVNDWGQVALAIGKEAHIAELKATSGRAHK